MRRLAGLFLVCAGLGLAGYVLFSLQTWDVQTARAQRMLQAEWNRRDKLMNVSLDQPAVMPSEQGQAGPDYGVAELRFPEGVHPDPLIVVDGVDTEDLKRGPGMYPVSEQPGDVGNFAVAGHRTTYGAPFNRIDELERDDVIEVLDRRGVVWRYRVHDKGVVEPDDVWVIGDDPLESGLATLTLTTCHPKYSARQRLIVHAVLVDEPDRSAT